MPALHFDDVFLDDDSALCSTAVQPQWVVQAREMCDAGLEYCWMGCLPLPPEGCGNQEPVCVNEVDADCGPASHDGTCHWTCPDVPEDTPTGPPGNNNGNSGQVIQANAMNDQLTHFL